MIYTFISYQMLSVVKTFGISDILQEAVFDRHSGLTDYIHPEQKADFRIAEKLQKRWTQVFDQCQAPSLTTVAQ